jgi:O-succinylbenzoic acid--CoA ligase
MVDGYFDDPAATAAAFIDGWYHTRDAGFVPEPGKLVILGRADDMLNIGGIKLAPHRIEDELRSVPGIADAALVAGSSPTVSSTLVVAVEPAAATLSPRAEIEIRSIVGRHVRDFELFPLPSFPRTETGKIRRGEIEAAFRRRQRQ